MKRRKDNDPVLEGLRFHGPGTYRIVIRGALDKGSWSDWLGEGTMMTTHTTERDPVTTLTCHFRDQAALLGVLNAFYDWHFPLVRVEYLANPAEAECEPEQ